MSASYNKRDGHTVITENVTKVEVTFLETLFDEQVEHDIKDALKAEEQRKFLTKICWIKLFVGIPEMFLVKFILGDKHIATAKRMQSLYWRFVRGKLSLTEFSRVYKIENGYSKLPLDK